MVAKALNRPSMSRPADDGDSPRAGAKDKVIQQLQPLLQRLKNPWVILGLFMVAYVPFGLMYMNAYKAHSDLQSQIDEQERVLGLAEPNVGDIELGLSSWTAALESAKAQQVLAMPSSDLLERLLNAANGTGVRIASSSTADSTRVQVGEDYYHASPVLLQVTAGNISNLQAFIAALEADAVGAVEVESSLVGTSAEGYTAAIRVLVFTRPFTPEELAADGKGTPIPTGRVTQEDLDKAAGGIK